MVRTLGSVDFQGRRCEVVSLRCTVYKVVTCTGKVWGKYLHVFKLSISGNGGESCQLLLLNETIYFSPPN